VKIGECIESGLWIQDGSNRTRLEPTGWTHDLSLISKKS
jgi:hypothetical protein